jgi:lipid II:glycine glycyltransferase (peptidoglycan interpeptide bridge formation enzyme)
MTAAPPERTICVDLEPPLEALRKNLAQKWRNGLNQAGRRGLSIAEGTSEDLMAEFEELYEAMWSKKRFESGVTVASFRALQRELPPTEKQRVLLARRDGRAVAGHVSSTLGDTCIYLLGASNEVGRETKASYLLQWRAMELAKEAGARRYDLGGIDPPRNPGVYHFKAGMGGIEVTFPASYAANGRGTGVLAPLLERGYRAWRGLRKNMEAIGT